jgi:hypothetical protein
MDLISKEKEPVFAKTLIKVEVVLIFLFFISMFVVSKFEGNSFFVYFYFILDAFLLVTGLVGLNIGYKVKNRSLIFLSWFTLLSPWVVGFMAFSMLGLG